MTESLGGPKNYQLEALEREARRLGQAGKQFAKAVEVNTRILELSPENLPALTRRGLSYLKLDNYPAAKEDLSRALLLYPGSSLVAEALKKIERGWDAAQERARRRAAENRRPAVKRKPAEKSKRQISEQTYRSREAKRHLVERDKARKRAVDEHTRRRVAEETRRRTERELRSLEQLTGFEEVFALGVAASKASSPNYIVAIAAFKKAYKLDPRRKVTPGRKPDPALFEVPTRLAAAYRLNGQLYEAQKMYEWVLERHESRFARVGLAAVHEDNGKHVQALDLYKSVLAHYPRDAYALRGVARTLASLGRIEEAVEAFEKAVEAGKDRNNAAAVLSALEKMREELRRKGELHRALQVGLALDRLRGPEG